MTAKTRALGNPSSSAVTVGHHCAGRDAGVAITGGWGPQKLGDQAPRPAKRAKAATPTMITAKTTPITGHPTALIPHHTTRYPPPCRRWDSEDWGSCCAMFCLLSLAGKKEPGPCGPRSGSIADGVCVALMRVIGSIDEPGFMGGRIDADPGPVIPCNEQSFPDTGIGQFVLLGIGEVEQTR